jgi:hypothetical protein
VVVVQQGLAVQMVDLVDLVVVLVQLEEMLGLQLLIKDSTEVPHPHGIAKAVLVPLVAVVLVP